MPKAVISLIQSEGADRVLVNSLLCYMAGIRTAESMILACAAFKVLFADLMVGSWVRHVECGWLGQVTCTVEVSGLKNVIVRCSDGFREYHPWEFE